MEPQRILLLAPHPDDGEFSCGGSLRKLSEQGHTIWYAAFSPCNKSLPKGFPPNTLYGEMTRALQHLGIQQENIITFDFPVREFPHFRQEILEELVKLKKALRPTWILLPNADDLHQDHHQIYREGIRAFKHCKLLGYELPWNNLSFQSNFHIRLEKKHIEAKIKAVAEYHSQNFRDYSDREFLLGLAKVRGTQVSADYAEAFQLIRWIL